MLITPDFKLGIISNYLHSIRTSICIRKCNKNGGDSISLSLIGRRGHIHVMIVSSGLEEGTTGEIGREVPTEEGDRTGGSVADQRVRPTEKEAEEIGEETILSKSRIKRMMLVSVMIWRVISREEEVTVGGTGGGRAQKLRPSPSTNLWFLIQLMCPELRDTLQ